MFKSLNTQKWRLDGGASFSLFFISSFFLSPHTVKSKNAHFEICYMFADETLKTAYPKVSHTTDPTIRVFY